MTVNIIIYQIIQGFEATPPVEKSAPSSKSQGIVTKSRDGTKNSLPKLSWGVLQIEDEDEDNLKLHLWLLHFRKLEGLLKQLGTFHRLIKSTHGDANSTHIMACGFFYYVARAKGSNRGR